LRVGVGSAHMSWVDTPLARESNEDLSTVRDMPDTLPASLVRQRPWRNAGGHLSKGSRVVSARPIAHAWSAEWLAPEARAAAAQIALELGGQRVAVDLAQCLGHVDLGVTPLLQ
jgi:hypothetical protein